MLCCDEIKDRDGIITHCPDPYIVVNVYVHACVIDALHNL